MLDRRTVSSYMCRFSTKECWACAATWFG